MKNIRIATSIIAPLRALVSGARPAAPANHRGALKMLPLPAVLALLLVAVAFATGLGSTAQAAPGNLDPTFGGDGVVTTDFGMDYDQAFGAAIQGDGKIVAAGGCSEATANFCLARYNLDGSLDMGFDTDGLVTTPLSGGSANAVAIQGDGKAVLAGTCFVSSVLRFCLARYNTDGSLDVTFDTDGLVTTVIGSVQANALAIQGDNKIVAAGYCRVGSQYDFCLSRYNANGSLDTSFSGDGMVTTAIGTGSTPVGTGLDAAQAVAIQGDGKIVAGGNCPIGTANDFCLVRYNPADGSLDTTFDTDGKVTTDIGATDDYVRSLAIQGDGKIVAAGFCADASSISDFCLARYNPADGSLDTTFDTDGKVTTAIGTSDDLAYGLAIQGDNIVAAGACIGGSYYNFCLARYNPNGSLDSTFDTDGVVTTDIYAGNDSARAVAIQGDGKIVAAGHCDTGSYAAFDFCLARYEGAAAADGDGDGISDGPDNCPGVYNPAQADFDGDGVGDACDPDFGADADSDGVPDSADNCPLAANPGQQDGDGDGLGDACDPDSDLDGIDDNEDNCPSISNPGQDDEDADGSGDACDPDWDIDSDGVGNTTDNCPSVYNPGQADLDGDGIGDVCDPDRDGDGHANADDNCPDDANPGQEDFDGNGIGDACDAGFDDNWDDDGVANSVDNCPVVYNAWPAAAPWPAAQQADGDGDGIGDRCEPDWRDYDNDGIHDRFDNCAPPIVVPGYTYNPFQEDADGNLVGDRCQLSLFSPGDFDSDGVADGEDGCPWGQIYPENTCDWDYDGDGVRDAADNCPGIVGAAAGANYNPDQQDFEHDGEGDVCDACPNSADSVNTDGIQNLNFGPDRGDDSCDPDDDNDGILDGVDGLNVPGEYDVAPSFTFTNDTTIGSLVPPHNPLNPDAGPPSWLVEGEGGGIRIHPLIDQIFVSLPGSGILVPLPVVACSSPQIGFSLFGLDDVVVTCGSAHIEVLVGEVEATIGTIPFSVPEGGSAEVNEGAGGGYEVTNNGGAAIVVGGLTVDPGQTVGVLDTDGDGIVNAVDPDDDGDGLHDAVDNCPLNANADQADGDGDGVGDACEPDVVDSDGDGIVDAADPCPNDAFNDADGDGQCGDVDPCPNDAFNDADGDGQCGDVDPCPNDALNDADGDGQCGDVDPCPNDALNDADGDGQCGDVDPCPNDPEDLDGYQDGDGCPDLDNDADGVPDTSDACPNVAEDLDGYQDGDGCPDPDNDGDGVPDTSDACPNLAEDVDGYQDGDGCPDLDNDADGVPDTSDACPNVAEDLDGYQDGDGCPDPDNDGDGVPDTSDACPNLAEDVDGYQDGDGCPDPDNDGDGVPDTSDACANVAEDLDGYQDGDGCPDLDNDGDGIPDVTDGCDNVAEDFDSFEDADGCPEAGPINNVCMGLPATVVGTNASELIIGTNGVDVILAKGGNDVILGRAGNDVVCAGDGNDAIDGGDGNDKIDAGNGADIVLGGGGADALTGGAGNDYIDGGSGNDVIRGGDGNDTLKGDAGADTVCGDGGVDNVQGGDGNDLLNSGAGNDTISGGNGNDVMDSGGGVDVMNGGSGSNSVGPVACP